MIKKKTGTHLRFYLNYVADGLMPYPGLCKCGMMEELDGEILDKYFTPEDFSEAITFWASGEKGDCQHVFTGLRQTIVLLMACLNDEL